MANYKLTNIDSIRQELEDVFLIEDIREYINILRSFFFKKAKAAISALLLNRAHITNEMDDYYKKYKQETSLFEVSDALDCYEIADNFLCSFDRCIERIVQEEIKNPTQVEYEEGDDIEKLIHLDDALWNKWADEIFPSKTRVLYKHTWGIDKYYESNFWELIERYCLK